MNPWLNARPELGRGPLGTGFAGLITGGLPRTPKPIIDAINGWVIDGGIESVLACDSGVSPGRPASPGVPLRLFDHGATRRSFSANRNLSTDAMPTASPLRMSNHTIIEAEG